MISLSVCMIVRDEEDVLERCLNCVNKIADEIIVVDTGSIDSTKKIAQKFSAKVYDFTWCYDFSKARNYSFSKATKEYKMWIDADDVISESEISKIITLKEKLSDKKVDVVNLKYSLGNNQKGNSSLLYYRERIVKNNANFKWIGQIHEVIIPKGIVTYENIVITHAKIKKGDPTRNLKIFQKMIKDGITFDSRQKFYYARELYYLKDYENAIKAYNFFLSDKNAWSENIICAYSDLAYIYEEKKDYKKMYECLINTLSLDFPSSQICCQFGFYFIYNEKVDIAIKWFMLARTQTEDLKSGKFYYSIYKEYIANIMLCVCYDKLRNYELSNFYNEEAGKYDNTDKIYLNNKQYLEKMLNFNN